MCKEWDRLVKKEVWGSERREMERRLDIQWREAQPTRRVVEVPGYVVWCVTCDETHIAVLALKKVEVEEDEEMEEDDYVRLFVYSATDLSLIYERQIGYELSLIHI